MWNSEILADTCVPENMHCNFALHSLKIWIHLVSSKVWFWFKFSNFLMYRSGGLLLLNIPLWEDRTSSVPQNYLWSEISVAGPAALQWFSFGKALFEVTVWKELWYCTKEVPCRIPSQGYANAFLLIRFSVVEIFLCTYSERMNSQWHRTWLWYWLVSLLHNI